MFTENRENILSEMKEISLLIAAASDVNVYAVPPGYFETLPENILRKVKEEEIILPNAGLPLTAPPESYFEDLAGNILFRIKSQTKVNEVEKELEEVAPLLNTINRENVYTVPSRYFENLQIEIPREEKRPAKVISFNSTRKNWMRYAMAAAVTGVIAAGILFFPDNRSGKNTASVGNIREKISTLSNDEIINYLDETTDAEIAPVNLQSFGNTDFDSYLKNMSDEEIKSYLKNNSDPDDNSVKGI